MKQPWTPGEIISAFSPAMVFLIVLIIALFVWEWFG